MIAQNFLVIAIILFDSNHLISSCDSSFKFSVVSEKQVIVLSFSKLCILSFLHQIKKSIINISERMGTKIDPSGILDRRRT